ncbi:MAG: SDR family oxidoreductase [Gammaproteobacteria bacterium]|nr:MAG: SDR family oxidoreductase [Gammaproteobacteria bacterium]
MARKPTTAPRARKPILVTGAAGALAQKVILLLQEKGYPVVAVDFREQVYLGEDIPSYRIDANKRGFEDIFRNHHPGGIVHLGRIMSSQSNRSSRYNMNVLGTQRLLDLGHKYGVSRTLILSTYHVYGAHAYNPALMDESSPLKAAELTMDLVDSVELENLASINFWRYPKLNITVLRPCNIVGPGVKNTMSSLLGSHYAPVLAGFSPMMQFIHIEDMAQAVVTAFEKNKKGIYNVAPDDCVAYQEALLQAGCMRIPIPGVPPVLPRTLARILGLKSFPPYLINYFKYPVVIDGSRFRETFGFRCHYNLGEIFRYYRSQKN